MTPRNVTYRRAANGPLYGGKYVYPAWRVGLAPFEYCEVPNTALSSVAPSTTPPGIAGPSAKINGWCGAATIRESSGYMNGPDGGHADYAGNEMSVCYLNRDTPAWEVLRGPTANADYYDNCVVNKDLSRSSPHTYWCKQFDDFNNRMLVVSTYVPFGLPGVPTAPGDWPWPSSTPGPLMAFDMKTKNWLPPNTLGNFPFGKSGGIDLTCSDPVNNKVYYVKDSHGKLFEYNMRTATWRECGNWYLNGGYCGSAVDNKRGRILAVGDFAAARDPEHRKTSDATLSGLTFGGLGASALRMSGYPGVVYDEANDWFLVFKNNSPIDVYRVRASDLYVDMPTITGTKPAQRPNGIQNSVQYMPELKGVAIANSYTGNIKFLATS